MHAVFLNCAFWWEEWWGKLPSYMQVPFQKHNYLYFSVFRSYHIVLEVQHWCVVWTQAGRASTAPQCLKKLWANQQREQCFLPMKELRQRDVRQFIVCHSQNLKKPMLLPLIYLIQCLNITTRFTPLSSHSYPVV